MERVPRKRRASKKMEEFMATQKTKSRKVEMSPLTAPNTEQTVQQAAEISVRPEPTGVVEVVESVLTVAPSNSSEVISETTQAPSSEPSPAVNQNDELSKIPFDSQISQSSDMPQDSLPIHPQYAPERPVIYTQGSVTMSDLEAIPDGPQITISQTETDKVIDMNQVEAFQNEFNLQSEQATDSILSEMIQVNAVSNNEEITPIHIIQDVISVSPLCEETTESSNDEQTHSELTVNATQENTSAADTAPAHTTERKNVTVNTSNDGVYQVISDTGEMLDAEAFLTVGGITSQQLINMVSVHADDKFNNDAEVYFLDVVVENQNGYQETFHVKVNNNSNKLKYYSTCMSGNSQSLTCEFCEYKTDKKSNMTKHMKCHLESRPFSCDFCSHKSRTTTNLKRHLLTHTNERNYGCSHCDLRFKQKIHLDKHISYRHAPKTVKCQLCDYTCANVTPDLKLHLKRKHLKNSVEDPPIFLECDKCGFLAASKKDLKQHIKFHKAGPELKLYCEHCSFVTDCKSRLNRHKLTHTKDKPYKCSECDYRATQKVHISRHMRSKHSMTVNSADIVETADIELEEQTAVINEDDQSIDASRNRRALHLQYTKNPVQPIDETPDNTEQLEEVVYIDTSEQLEQTNQTPADVSESQANTQEIAASHSNTQMIFESQSTTQEILVNQLEETVLSSKSGTSLKYEPRDYTEKPKIFGCTHCTMKFVKLLSLYKHLHAQHQDQLDCEDRLTCVICDYKALNYRSLLLHMRKHNQNESVEDPNDKDDQLYMCVLCRYMNTKKRNLYQHLKNKHKIDMAFRKQESTSANQDPVVVIAHENGTELTEIVQLGSDGVGKCNLSTRFLNIKDFTNSLDITHQQSTPETEKRHVHIEETVRGGLEQTAAEAIVDLGAENSEMIIEEQLVESIYIPHEDSQPHDQSGDQSHDQSGDQSHDQSGDQSNVVHEEITQEVESFKLTTSQMGSLKEGDIIQVDNDCFQISVTEDGSITATQQETPLTTVVPELTISSENTTSTVKLCHTEQTTPNTNKQTAEYITTPASVTVIL